MRKTLCFCILALGMALGQQAMAQSIFSNIFGSKSKNVDTTTATTTETTSEQNLGSVLGNVLGGVVSQAGEKGSLLGNILSNVTGGLTTTKANLIGTWTYTEPAVQFESENLLTRAGGIASATKVEKKLVTYYKMVGIAEGSLKFSFNDAGEVVYSLGRRSFKGTYVFDDSTKTLTISTQTGQTIKAYVTISANQMSLCFDSTKVLTLFSSISKSFNTTLSQVAGQYSGMKTGFKFTRQ